MADQPQFLLSGVTPALVTPFKEDGSGVNKATVAPLVELHLAAGVSGFYICGSTGEGAAMNVTERRDMAEATVAAVQGRVPVIAHVGACPLEDAIELAKHAESLGVSAISSVVPRDRPGDLAAAVEYFTALGAATSLPFYVYWVASTAEGGMTARRYLNAVKDVPNLAGLKFTDMNFFLFQQIMALAEEIVGRPLNCVTGPDEMAVGGLAMGSHGAIGSTYNVQPKLNVAMHNAFRAGDVKAATSLQAQCNKMIALFFDHCNLAERGTNIVAGIKAIYRSRGFDVGYAKEATGFISEEQEKALLAAVETIGWTVE